MFCFGCLELLFGTLPFPACLPELLIKRAGVVHLHALA